MDEKYVSYLAFESAMARQERTIRRLWILAIILIIVLMVTNGLWLCYESQFEEVVVSQEATADGSNDIHLQNIGGDYYGRTGETNH